ncbi:MAG: lantibiotic dehydratase [Acidobacteriota bacterium]
MNAIATEEPKTLAEHLVGFTDDSWAFWRSAVVRGAGFPADLVTRLGFPECGEAAREVLDAETEHAASLDAARRAADLALDELKASGGWDDKARRKPLLDLRRSLAAKKVPDTAAELLAEELVTAIGAATERLAAARAGFTSAYELAVARQSEAIHETASMPRFRAAVLWQNRSAFHTAVEKIAQKPPTEKRDSRRRQHEELVASYLQRYATKNDTIGFFGPACLARFVEDGESLTARPGAELIADRDVKLESWCVLEVAKALAEQEGVKAWLPPRPMPLLHLEGNTLHAPTIEPTELPRPAAVVFRACDGQLTAGELARQVVADTNNRFQRPDEVFFFLGQLAQNGALDWGFDVPVSPLAFAALREQVEAIGDEAVRDRCRSALEDLETARQAVAEAAGDPAALDQAMDRLGAVFTSLTGQDAQRRGGETYAGRTLVFEDCLRDLEVDLGRDLRAELEAPLSLVLHSARWFSAQVATRFRRLAGEIHQEIAQQVGSRTIPGMLFWGRVQDLFFGADEPLEGEALAELHRRWRDILGFDANQRRIELRSTDLRQSVLEAFASPPPGWQQGRYNCPDVLIDAPNVEAVRRGDYQLVLGEVHLALNSLNSWAVVGQLPARQELLEQIDVDLPDPRLLIMMGRSAPGQTTRTQWAHRSNKDFIMPPVDRPVSLPASQALSILDLVVRETDSGLTVGTREGRVQLDVVEALGQFLSFRVMRGFRLAGGVDHWPRVTIDRVVVWRESWTVDAEGLDFATLSDPAERFLAARRVAEAHGFPRFVFVKAPVEEKPFYVDLDSPIYVDQLAKVVRRTRSLESGPKSLRISEMLPTPDQAWLPDAEGQRFTSELRIVTLDLQSDPTP